ncbi:hypothetical protein PC123_g2780 [Phytophthora cactorum]|nr:hypothetical protein PC123_g2780 [Phytophthora cactorum]
MSSYLLLYVREDGRGSFGGSWLAGAGSEENSDFWRMKELCVAGGEWDAREKLPLASNLGLAPFQNCVDQLFPALTNTNIK